MQSAMLFCRGVVEQSVARLSTAREVWGSSLGWNLVLAVRPHAHPALMGTGLLTGNQPRRGKELATLLHYAVGLV